jgi:hypothetical protein
VVGIGEGKKTPRISRWSFLGGYQGNRGVLQSFRQQPYHFGYVCHPERCSADSLRSAALRRPSCASG